jgi:hypothetical protein
VFEVREGLLVGDVLTTLWGLIAFAGFVTTLLIPKADEYSAIFRDSVEETDRGTAARWSTAVRSIPGVVLAGVIAIVASAAATATWRSNALTTMDFWLLVASILAQAGFAFTVRYLVPVVPAEIVLLRPVAGGDWRKLRSASASRETSIRFDNQTNEDLVLHWIDYNGQLDQRQLICAQDSAHRITYLTRPFRISTVDDRDVAVFEPVKVPAVAVITSPMISPPSGRRQVALPRPRRRWRHAHALLHRLRHHRLRGPRLPRRP